MTRQEYRIMKRLSRHLKERGHSPAILTDDFYNMCPYDKATVSSILVELKNSGLIYDTYTPHAASTHAVEIADKGALELRFYRTKWRDRIITILLSAIATECIHQLITWLLRG